MPRIVLMLCKNYWVHTLPGPMWQALKFHLTTAELSLPEVSEFEVIPENRGSRNQIQVGLVQTLNQCAASPRFKNLSGPSNTKPP